MPPNTMNKQDMLKIQSCVLRVNIHCEGCMHKVKKKLQKVEGVYKVSIDSEQGKVVVSGNVDPATLIEKLEKAGKHAELWGGGPKPFMSIDQLKKFQQMESINKNGKKGNHELQKNGNGFLQIPKEKGFKEEKLFSGKDQKSVSFHLPREEEFDDDYDEEFDEDDEDFDDEDEDFDDEFDDEFGDGGFDAHKPPAKGAAAGFGQKPSKVASNGKGEKEGKAKKGGGGGGGGFDVFLKGMLKKAGRKKGDSDQKKSKKGEKKKEEGAGGKNGGGKKGGFEFGDLKKGKNDDGRSKKGGGDGFDGGKLQQQGFHEMKASHKGGGGGGRNMDIMGQKGGFPAPAVAGMPAMNGGGFMPGPGNNPYSQQQQYMAHMMMMMNQQRENGHGAYHPAYARPPAPAMGYGPPPAMVYGPPPVTTEHYTHMFSDENTGSCSIM